MSENTHRRSTVRVPVPVVASRGWTRGAGWTAYAELEAGRPHSTYYFCGDGKTEGEAKADVAAAVAGLVARTDESRGAMVIGGAPYYADSIHVILPDTHGWRVEIARGGRSTGSWHTSTGSFEDELARVLSHVGGTPAVVRF
jgi:hypothetical protein